MDCGRPIDKAPVIFPSKLLQDVEATKEHMFSGHLEKSPSDDWKKNMQQSDLACLLKRSQLAFILYTPFGGLQQIQVSNERNLVV